VSSQEFDSKDSDTNLSLMLFGLMYPASASPLRGLPYYSISTMVRMLSNWRLAATARLTGAFAMANGCTLARSQPSHSVNYPASKPRVPALSLSAS